MKYEYKAERISSTSLEALERHLNGKAQNGWRCVGVTGSVAGFRTTYGFAVFEREISTPPPVVEMYRDETLSPYWK